MEVVNQILSLGKTDRVQLAKEIRSNQNVWNAVHGFGSGGLLLEKGIVEGLVVRESKLEEDVLVRAVRLEEPMLIEAMSAIEIESPVVEALTEKVIAEESEELVGETYEVITDASGAYQLELPVGLYEITYTKVGVASVVMENVSSITESTSTINVELV